MNLYARQGDVKHARKLFDRIPERDVGFWRVMILDVVITWTRCYCSNRCAGNLLGLMIHLRECFEVVQRFGMPERVREGMQIHGCVEKWKFAGNLVVRSALLCLYARCRKMKDVRLLFDSMKQRDLFSTSFQTFATQFGFAQRNSFRSDAFDIFKEMILMRTQMDEVVVSSMLKMCTTIAAISTGRQIHYMYAKSGEIEDTVLAFKEMAEKDVRSWTSLISGHGRHGNIEKAIDLYNRMEHEGTQPNDVTFLALLSACSHTGKTELGWNIFNTMISKYGIKVREEHSSCIVDMLARGGNLEEAYELISENGIQDLAHRSSSSAASEYGPKKPVNYINLASVYALKTRKLMKESGSCNKAPGYSFVY
ncbi:hypothetical protein N665_1847s0006 [Sinapis alba]|nr:hypothetical protein N665_1847s0006 [Sinapis alba]